jgi:hypothetical protein
MKYEIAAERFDLGDKWGAAIRFERDGKRHSHAIRIPDGSLTEREVLARAVPVLLDWAFGLAA